jgi:hypothetical protein
VRSAFPALAENSMPPLTGHYLFAWTGDADKKGNDFLAVIDADPCIRDVWPAGYYLGDRSTDRADPSHRIRDAGQRNAVRQ